MRTLQSIRYSCRIFTTLLLADWFARRRSPNVSESAKLLAPGVSVLIPERGTPAGLRETIASLHAAIERVREPIQVIVVVNGSPASDYAELQTIFPQAEWHFVREPLGFNEAVIRGLACVRHDWTYLLNSDMRLDEHALAELLPHRAESVFAIASQIYFDDAQRRREETGWTDYVDDAQEVEIFDMPPFPDMGMRAGLYAGGGSSLFRTALLRTYAADTTDYTPFYFEDAEWGTRAWREGKIVLFCPRSVAWHRHRATIDKYYAPTEVERILRRNRLLFDLRNAWTLQSTRDLMRKILAADAQTQAELTHPPLLRRLLAARSEALRARRNGFDQRACLEGPRVSATADRNGSDATGSLTPADEILLRRTEPSPRILWIELTSRCPFDCIFCSRKLLRGAGQHMDFEMFRRLIAELKSPDIIRLNYSGESSHYPKLVEACELAAATGARVELVTALAALPEHKLSGLVLSGLTRLTISLHTLDAAQFTDIYRFSSLEAMQKRIVAARDIAKQAARKVQIDFAFVAMRRNLDQLLAVAGYATALGITRLAVHPVIRRDPIEETFDDEIEDGRLRPKFVDALNATIAACRAQHVDLTIESSTPELDHGGAISTTPAYHPQPLPHGAIIHSCDQDPWQTVHVLANGDVVICEQRDQIKLGNLHAQTLATIWRSPEYMQFRADYVAARDRHCIACPYKKAALPVQPPERFAAPDVGLTSLGNGWFQNEPGDIVWSRRSATMELRGRGTGRLLLRGYLPAVARSRNALEIRVNGTLLARVSNRHASLHGFQIERSVVADGTLRIEFKTAMDFCPAEQHTSEDSRRLGFALAEAAFEGTDRG